MFDIERATKGKKLFQINNYFDKTFMALKLINVLLFLRNLQPSAVPRLLLS